MRAVTGSRVQLLCVDASSKFVVFGSNIGSVYVFERRGVGGLALEDRNDIHTDDIALPIDGPLKFKERFMVETHAGSSASKPIVKIKINPQRSRIALAFDDGELEVCEFSCDDCGDGSSSTRASSQRVSGRYEAGVPSGHKGNFVTSVSWSPAGDAFACGDDNGAVSVVHLEGRDAGAHTIRFEQPITQVDFMDSHGTTLLMSTTAQLYLMHRHNGFKKTPIGGKPRDGNFGAASHPWTKAAVPESCEYLEDDEGDENEKKKKTWWMFGARPGRRLWVCKASTDGELSEAKVLATVRPSIPEPSPNPGCSREKTETSTDSTTLDVKSNKRKPKKWEFGRLHVVGPCLLSSSNSTIAVIDIVNASVLAWYPLEADGNKNGGMGLLRSDVATCGPRTFGLGTDGGVWCLHTPSTVSALASTHAAQELKLRETAPSSPSAQHLTPGQHLERITERLKAVRVETSCEKSKRTQDEQISKATPWERANSSRALSLAMETKPEPEAMETKEPEPYATTGNDAPCEVAEELQEQPYVSSQPSASSIDPIDTPSKDPPASDALPETVPVPDPSTSNGSDTTQKPETDQPIGFITRMKNAKTQKRHPAEHVRRIMEITKEIATKEIKKETPDRPNSPFPVIVDGIVIDLVDTDGRPVRTEELSSQGTVSSEIIAKKEITSSTPTTPSTTLSREEASDGPSIEHSPKSETENETKTSLGQPGSPSGIDPATLDDKLDVPDSPHSPQANETNQLFAVDQNPWWMRFMGCEGREREKDPMRRCC